MLELVGALALGAVEFGFCGAVGVDAAFGEEVGAAAGDDEGRPAVAAVGSVNAKNRFGYVWRKGDDVLD